MPAISLSTVAPDSQSPSTSFTASFTAAGSSRSSFASYLSGTGTPQGKDNTYAGQADSSSSSQPGQADLLSSANLPNAGNLSIVTSEPAIANQNLPADKRFAAPAAPVNLDATPAETNKADALNPNSAKIELSTAIPFKADGPASGIPGKVAPTPASSRKKENTGPALLALSVAAIASPQWTPSLPSQPPVSEVAKSAGAVASSGNADAAVISPRPEITNWANANLTAFAQTPGTQAQSSIPTLQFDAKSTHQSAFPPQSLHGYAQIDSRAQTQLPSGSDLTTPNPATTGAPQDAPLAWPLTDSAQPLEAVPINAVANNSANVETQTYPQSGLPDSHPQATAPSPLPVIDSPPNAASSPATGPAVPETQVVAPPGLAEPTSPDTAANAVRDTALEVKSSASSAHATQMVAADTHRASSETKARLQEPVNFTLPIQTPASRAVTHPSPVGSPLFAPPPDSNAHAPIVPHAANADSKVPPDSPASSSSALEKGNINSEFTGSVQLANQNLRSEKPSTMNHADSKGAVSKTTAPAKANGNNNPGATQNSLAEAKTTSPLPMPVAPASAPAANMQVDAANAGPLIAGVQSAANSSIKTDAAAAQPKTEPALDNAPPPEPAPLPAARIFHNPSQSEMHVGFRTESFGAVEVRTTISEKQVEIALGSERGDLKGFMTSELPALQSNLQQHDLRLQSLRTNVPAYAAQSDVFSGTGGQPQDPQRQGQVSRSAMVPRIETTHSEDEDSWEPGSGLSLRI